VLEPLEKIPPSSALPLPDDVLDPPHPAHETSQPTALAHPAQARRLTEGAQTKALVLIIIRSGLDELSLRSG